MVGFNSIFLLAIRREALRKCVWFRALDSTERAILTLVPRCMEKPKSAKLIDALARIIVKIKSALTSHIDNLLNQFGRPLAERLSRIAHGWGHETACEWAKDERFSRYLVIVEMNSDFPCK